MAARRGKSQARRRNAGNQGGLPMWAGVVLGIVLTVAVIFLAPRFLGKDDGGGFVRPRPNPDAIPAPVTGSEAEAEAVPEARPARAAARAPAASDAAESGGTPAAQTTEFDFYTLLPGQEVAMTGAQLAAAAREERAREERARQQQQAAAEAARPKPLDETASPQPPTAPARSEPAATAPAPTATAAAPAGSNSPTPTTPSTAAAPATTAPAPRNDTPYILQAGAFQASGDAEALKARIALLGLSARVESATINGKTMYRVRTGPYASAAELASAKSKLDAGGLQSVAIRAR